VRTTVAAVVLAVGLSGCAAARDVPTIDGTATSATGSVPSSAPEATAATTPPGAAGQALARFDATNLRTAQRATSPGGRAFIDALVEAGFRRSDMQVTADRTTIGLAVPSVQFSVLVRGVCLIGQDGPESSGYRSVVVAPVDGRCLIGATRAIDW
jgi:hypothetical protein